MGNTWYVFLVSSSTVILEIFLSLALVPKIGLIGAGLGRALSGLIGGIIGLYYARKFAYLPERSFVMKVLLSSILPSAFISAMSTFISNHLITIVPYSIAGLALFLLSLRLFRVLAMQDIAILEDALPKMLRFALKFFKV
jgi:peptidoglycan biosynthesis protein MviN/MurJ (putative lipid II flippase)